MVYAVRVDENADVAAALLSADMEHSSEETMEYETWKKMKTAADDFKYGLHAGPSLHYQFLRIPLCGCMGKAGRDECLVVKPQNVDTNAHLDHIA